jgi:hypothetical protein
MQPHTSVRPIFSVLLALTCAVTAMASPVNFSEVSLWVRAKETDQSIVRQVSQRKLTRALTPQQETTLKSQGASDSLVQSLRSPNVIATAEEVAATEVKSQSPRTTPPQPQEPAGDPAADNLRIFEVSSGHPINLSQWGGPDYEFAFNICRFAGEDIVEPVVIDTVRTYTDVPTYVGLLSDGPRSSQPHYRGNRFTPYLGGDLKDNTYMIGGYVSAVSHSTSRGMSIDKKNPVVINGVPYVLYPIYGVRGVSLYYIGSGTNSVKLAVSSSGR